MSLQLFKSALLVLVAVSLVDGCVSKQSAPTRFHVLESLPATTAPLAQARREPSLAVDLAALRLPQYLERPQIVSRVAAGRLVIDDYSQWGGNLGKDMMRVLARNLSLLLASGNITVYSRRPAGPPVDARVDIEVLQFERGPDNRVLLSAQWWMQTGADNAPATSQVTDLVSDPLPAEAQTDDTVAAMSALLGRFSMLVADAVAQRTAR